jgi:membrane protein
VALPSITASRLPRPLGVLVGTVQRARQDGLVGRSAECAFFALLSLPTTFLAVLGGVGYVAGALGIETTRRIEGQVYDVAGIFLSSRTVDDILRPAVQSLLSEGRADIIGIGLLITLWSASRAIKVMMAAVQDAYQTAESRSPLQRRLIAVVVTIVGMIAGVLVIPLLVAGPRLGAAIGAPFGLEDAFRTAWTILYWPVASIVGVGLLATFYEVTLPGHQPWLRRLPGAAFAVAMWLLASAALRLYARSILEADTPYGPLAAPFVLLLWLYVTSMAVILGAELNAETAR